MAQFEIRDGDAGPWVLDLDKLMIDEALQLQRLTGLGPRQWVEALVNDEPLAVRFAFYIARKRAGEDDLSFGDVEVNLFGMSITEIPEAAEVTPDLGVTDETAEVVPTGPATDQTDEASTST